MKPLSKFLNESSDVTIKVSNYHLDDALTLLRAEDFEFKLGKVDRIKQYTVIIFPDSDYLEPAIELLSSTREHSSYLYEAHVKHHGTMSIVNCTVDEFMQWFSGIGANWVTDFDHGIIAKVDGRELADEAVLKLFKQNRHEDVEITSYDGGRFGSNSVSFYLNGKAIEIETDENFAKSFDK